MDLVDLIQEKRFLGQEFLAWLWFKSEERGGPVDIPGIRINVNYTDRLISIDSIIPNHVSTVSYF